MPKAIPPDFILLTGQTFPVKDQLKDLGCIFGERGGEPKGWYAPPEQAPQAQTIVDNQTHKPQNQSPTKRPQPSEEALKPRQSAKIDPKAKADKPPPRPIKAKTTSGPTFAAPGKPEQDSHIEQSEALEDIPDKDWFSLRVQKDLEVAPPVKEIPTLDKLPKELTQPPQEVLPPPAAPSPLESESQQAQTTTIAPPSPSTKSKKAYKAPNYETNPFGVREYLYLWLTTNMELLITQIVATTHQEAKEKGEAYALRYNQGPEKIIPLTFIPTAELPLDPQTKEPLEVVVIDTLSPTQE